MTSFFVEEDEKKQIDYVKKSYKQGEFTEFYVGNERVGYRAEEDGIVSSFRPDIRCKKLLLPCRA